MAKSRASGAKASGLAKENINVFVGAKATTGVLLYDDERLPWYVDAAKNSISFDRDTGKYNIQGDERAEKHNLTVQKITRWQKHDKDRSYIEISGSEFIDKAFFLHKKEDIDLNYYNAVSTKNGTLYYHLNHPSGVSFVQNNITREIDKGLKKLFE